MALRITGAKEKPRPDIHDAKRDLAIHVSLVDVQEALLKRGKRDPDACAAATALCRHTPGVDYARVSRSFTIVKRNGRLERYRTPAALRDQILLFDRAGIFEPGEYVLRAIPPSSTREYMSEHNRTSNARRSITARRTTKHAKHAIPGVRGRLDYDDLW